MMNYDKAHPRTVLDAIDLLEAGLSERDKQTLCMTGVAGAHHSLGRNIRNGWDLWDPETPIVRQTKADFGVDHADDISGLILGGLHARLCGETFDFEAEAQRYRDHWAEVAGGGTAADGPALAFPNRAVIPFSRSAGEAPRKRGFLSRLFGDRHA